MKFVMFWNSQNYWNGKIIKKNTLLSHFHLQFPFKHHAINGDGKGGGMQNYYSWSKGGRGVWRGPYLITQYMNSSSPAAIFSWSISLTCIYNLLMYLINLQLYSPDISHLVSFCSFPFLLKSRLQICCSQPEDITYEVSSRPTYPKLTQ